MALSQIVTQHPDSSTHRRRIAETVNGILRFQNDDSRVQTPAEIAAGVTPVNYAYAPDHIGWDVRREGAALNGTTDDKSALSSANSVGSALYVPRGTARVGSNLTITVPMWMDYQSRIKPDAGMTVNVGAIVAGSWQIFDVSNAGSAVLGFTGTVVNGMWFGMQPDGNFVTGAFVTDNSLPLQRAVNALAVNGGGALYIPPGIYYCSTQVRIPSGVAVYGAGKYSTILFAPTAFSNVGGLIAINGFAGPSGYPTVWKGISVIGQQGGSGGQGIVSTKNGTFISDVWIAAWTAHAGVVLSQTDNRIFDFEAESNLYGVEVTECHVTVENFKTYQNAAAGILVSNSGSTENGRVMIANGRSGDDAQNAILVSSGKRVTISACDAASLTNAKYSAAAFQIDSSTDVVLSACTGTLTAGASTAPGILLSSSSSDVTIGTCKIQGFYDGLQANGASNLDVCGGRFASNTRHGVLLSGGGPASVTGIQATNNGAVGIDSENTAGSGWHLIAGNGCFSNGTFGIVANITIGTAFTNVQGNMARGNTSGNLSYTGTTANINEGTTPTNY